MVSRSAPVDRHVGSRVRLRRTLLGMSQEQLGERAGLTFQHVQKYERGANRISAGRLFRIACALDVRVSYFFDDLPQEAPSDRQAPRSDDADDIMTRRETLELVAAFYSRMTA